MDVLTKIINTKKELLEDELDEFSELKSHLPVRDFTAAIRKKQPSVIAEIKYASPAKGNFNINFSPDELAKLYEKGGASALSVLACRPYFNGSPQYVYQVKQVTSLPVLWKDFIFDVCQIELAKRLGADAILLMCSVLGNKLPDFIKVAKDLNLTPVVEVFTEAEVELAKKSNAEVILINNRNLKTLDVSLNVSNRLMKQITHATCVISASGISNNEDISYLKKSGVNIYLVGESLARQKQPDKALQQLLRMSGGEKSYENA